MREEDLGKRKEYLGKKEEDPGKEVGTVGKRGGPWKLDEGYGKERSGPWEGREDLGGGRISLGRRRDYSVGTSFDGRLCFESLILMSCRLSALLFQTTNP